MSADNGVYIFKSLEGYRVTHAQAIENLYWWYDDERMYENSHWDKLQEEHGCIPHEFTQGKEKEELNPKMIISYFGKCKVFSNEFEAFQEAKRIHDEHSYTEYGISYIKGWEDKPFPTE